MAVGWINRRPHYPWVGNGMLFPDGRGSPRGFGHPEAHVSEDDRASFELKGKDARVRVASGRRQ
jgi:hypothetical protein